MAENRNARKLERQKVRDKIRRRQEASKAQRPDQPGQHPTAAWPSLPPHPAGSTSLCDTLGEIVKSNVLPNSDPAWFWIVREFICRTHKVADHDDGVPVEFLTGWAAARAQGEIAYEPARFERAERMCVNFRQLDRLANWTAQYRAIVLRRPLFSELLVRNYGDILPGHAGWALPQLVELFASARAAAIVTDLGVPLTRAAIMVEAEASWIFRDVIGDPSSPDRPDFDHRWRSCDVMVIAKAAEASCRDGDQKWHERLPVLADALADAGCNDQAILEHLRLPTSIPVINQPTHVPGCWALRQVLAGSNPLRVLEKQP